MANSILAHLSEDRELSDSKPAGVWDQAPRYQQLGFPIFPIWPVDENGVCTCPEGQQCLDTGKHPMTTHGLLNATTDMRAIDNWAHSYPEANLGIRTGEASGFDVLDVDVKSGGPESLAALEAEYGPLPQTPTAITGSGGRQYLFRHAQGVRNSQGTIAKGIDTRGDGGYIVAAPSNHKSGGRYSWEPGKAPWEIDLAAWPAPLLERLSTKSHQEYEPGAPRIKEVDSVERYIEGTKRGIFESVSTAREHERHPALYKGSAALGNLINYIPQEESEHILSSAVEEWGVGINAKDRETIRDGLAKGISNPTTLIVKERPALTVVPTGIESLDPVDPAINLDKLPDKTVDQYLDNQEQGAADMLAHLYRGRLLFDHGQWYMWGSHHWEQTTPETLRLLITGQVARQHIIRNRDLSDEAARAGEGSDKDSLLMRAESHLSRARSLRTYRTADNVLKLAAGRLSIPRDWAWDSNPWLLGVENGVIDLKTGELQEGRPGDMILTYAPIDYRGKNEPAPEWERTIKQIFQDQPDTAEYVQRLLGYGLTGLSQEHVMPVFWGEGRNGKDTIIETLGRILGDVAGPVSRDVFLGGKHDAEGRSGAATPHLMALRGKRLVWCAEASGRLHVEQVKKITGGNVITGRWLNRNMESFVPTHLPILITNDKPTAPVEETALWDRLVLIAFNKRFVDDPKEPNELKKDSKLKDRLPQEASGILAWMVRGCLEWQQRGLERPQAVIAATEEYHEEQDLLGQFLEEYTVADKTASVRLKDLHTAYGHYLEHAHGIRRAPARSEVGKQLSKRKYTAHHSNKGQVYKGLKLRMTPEDIFNELTSSGSGLFE